MKRTCRAITLGTTPLLAMLVLSGCQAPGMTTSANPQQPTREQVEQQMVAAQKQLRDMSDKLLSTATKAGKAIVVTSTINLDSSPTRDFTKPEVSAEFLRERSSLTEWRSADNPANSFKVGNGQSALDIGDVKGSHMQVVFGRTLYQVFVVEPGTYNLVGSTHVIPRISLANPAANTKIRRSALGDVVLDETTFTEFEKGQRWQDATYRTDRIRQTRCTSVRVVNGECMSTADASYDQVQQTGAAGWTSTTKANEVAGVKAKAQLRKPFASFSVAPGEVVLVDGFYGDAPNFGFAEKDCERVESAQIRCEINRYSMVRVPTSVQDFRKTTPPAELGLPLAGEALAKVQYREPKIFAKATGTSSTRWGQDYVLTER